jgi:hypothetical protein
LISIVGSALDVLGALYLAYDLLGGEHGPLRTLTRAVTYGTLFGTGYGLALEPVFGLVSGWRTAPRSPESFRVLPGMSPLEHRPQCVPHLRIAVESLKPTQRTGS